jgi:penicillin-binding protein 2
MRTFRQKWYAGETISVSIGQGALIVTPLQLARAIGGIATGGVWQKPHLVLNEGSKDAARRAEVKLENVLQVIEGMHGVTAYGTGGRARLPGIEVCGKTGTAQLASNTLLNSAAGRHMKDNAWFVGFAPKQSPEIVVVALFEAGEHGNLAAPIVRDVLKAYFDKKVRRMPEQRLASLPSIGWKTTGERRPPPPMPEAYVAQVGQGREEEAR